MHQQICADINAYLSCHPIVYQVKALLKKEI